MGALVSRLVGWWSHSASHALRGLIGPPGNNPDNAMSQEGRNFPTSVLVFTQNIARHPIAWDPASQRPTQELVHAVHSALHFALDPCVDHPDEEISLGVADGTLVIPNRKDLKVREPPSQGWGVYAKLFVRTAPKDSAAYVQIFESALAELRKGIGATVLESFVVSLQDIYWDGEKQDEVAEPGDIGKLLDLWEVISSRAELKEIGVSDFSVDHLKRLLALVDTKNSCENDGKKSATPLRRPTINQLNLSPSAAEPTALLELTQSEGIHLQTHSDDLGTTKQIVSLLSEFEDRLPLSPAFIDLRGQERYDEALSMEWVLKYTVFNRDRGLVGEKGYIVSAKLAV